MYPCIEAILLDLDGTLVDSEKPLHNSWREAVAAYGHDFSKFSYLDIIGASEAEKVEVVLAFFGITEDPQVFYAQLMKTMRERLPDEMALMPGAVPFLETCLETGAPRGLITSASSWHANLALEKFGLRKYFHPNGIVTAETRGLDALKPSPAPYLMGARRFGAKPLRCIAFEDSVRGVTAALAAGMNVVAIPHDLSPRPVLQALDRRVYVLPEGKNIGDFTFDAIEPLLPR